MAQEERAKAPPEGATRKTERSKTSDMDCPPTYAISGPDVPRAPPEEPVEIGLTDGKFTQITSGLQPNQIVGVTPNILNASTR